MEALSFQYLLKEKKLNHLNYLKESRNAKSHIIRLKTGNYVLVTAVSYLLATISTSLRVPVVFQLQYIVG